MPTMMASLGLDKLTADEQAQLLLELQEKLARERSAPGPLTDSQRAELKRRLEDIEANPDDWIPWDEVRAEVKRRYPV